LATLLAVTLGQSGQHERARQLGEDTLTRCRRVLGDDHPWTLISATHLTATLGESRHYERARHLGEDTLTRCRRVLGDDHPYTLRLTHILAAARSRAGLGEHDQAR
jgi:hypothetical protein